MADAKISELTELAAGAVAADDLLVIVDTSATATKKLQVRSLPVERLLAPPVTVNLNDGSAQAVYTVPVGKTLIPTRALLRSFTQQPDDGSTATVTITGSGTLFTIPMAGGTNPSFAYLQIRAAGWLVPQPATTAITVAPNAAYGSACTAVLELYGIEY